MGNVLEAIAKTVSKIIGWVDLPLVSCAVVFCIENSVGCQVPHLRISILHVLFHTEESFLGSIVAIAHCTKFD